MHQLAPVCKRIFIKAVKLVHKHRSVGIQPAMLYLVDIYRRYVITLCERFFCCIICAGNRSPVHRNDHISINWRKCHLNIGNSDLCLPAVTVNIILRVWHQPLFITVLAVQRYGNIRSRQRRRIHTFRPCDIKIILLRITQNRFSFIISSDPRPGYPIPGPGVPPCLSQSTLFGSRVFIIINIYIISQGDACFIGSISSVNVITHAECGIWNRKPLISQPAYCQIKIILSITISAKCGPVRAAFTVHF
ncbi:unknown [Hungatella hathewayi CAG:224]|nr:unknown [Hungatella hathewayi CAG:224]